MPETRRIHADCTDRLKDHVEVVTDPEEWSAMLPAYCPACDGRILNGEEFVEHTV